MVDIHTHFIYGVDDGYKDIEHSMEDLKVEAEMGVTDVICTPHFRKGMFETHLEIINRHFSVLKEFVTKEKVNINLYLGC
ncbi:MAG: CpsB/CapC family capsule biosynthesis tyrosine phosphatase, partial [Bacilli bacterium]